MAVITLQQLAAPVLALARHGAPLCPAAAQRGVPRPPDDLCAEHHPHAPYGPYWRAIRSHVAAGVLHLSRFLLLGNAPTPALACSGDLVGGALAV
jgi:hypothetical protein